MEPELKLTERLILSWLIGFAGIVWGGYAFVTGRAIPPAASKPRGFTSKPQTN